MPLTYRVDFSDELFNADLAAFVFVEFGEESLILSLFDHAVFLTAINAIDLENRKKNWKTAEKKQENEIGRKETPMQCQAAVPSNI